MLTADELRTLIGDHESDRVELTTSTTKTDKFGEAICAFANDFPNHRQPGYLICSPCRRSATSGPRSASGATTGRIVWNAVRRFPICNCRLPTSCRPATS